MHLKRIPNTWISRWKALNWPIKHLIVITPSVVSDWSNYGHKLVASIVVKSPGTNRHSLLYMEGLIWLLRVSFSLMYLATLLLCLRSLYNICVDVDICDTFVYYIPLSIPDQFPFVVYLLATHCGYFFCTALVCVFASRLYCFHFPTVSSLLLLFHNFCLWTLSTYLSTVNFQFGFVFFLFATSPFG